MKPCCSRTVEALKAETMEHLERRIIEGAREVARRLLPAMVVEALDGLGVEAMVTPEGGVKVIGPRLPTEPGDVGKPN